MEMEFEPEAVAAEETAEAMEPRALEALAPAALPEAPAPVVAADEPARRPLAEAMDSSWL